MGECSRTGMSGLIWNMLWKLKIPNKIKIFGWRAWHNALPTRENLFKRRVVDDASCELCQQATETVVHVLWECGVAQDIWAGCRGILQKRVCDQVDFFQLMEDMRDRLSREELELFWGQCWLIWNQRNTVVHGGKIQHPSGLTKRAMDYNDEFKNSQVHLAIPVSVGAVQRWRPPSGSVYKVNFDAPVFASTDSSGVGVIIRNDKGEAMAALSVAGPSVSTSEEAEVLACRKALEFAVDAGFRDVVVEGDNSAVMKAILSPRARWSRLGHLYEDISCRLRGLGL